MKIWVKSDLNGFFGLFTNNLTNILVMSGLLTGVVGFPDDLVFRRIVPAAGLSIFLASAYYTYMAIKLARKAGSSSVTALPSGISVPHMFLITFMIIAPVYWATGDASIAWGAGVAWAFLEGIIELIGSLVGEKMRRSIPRSALLGSLAGISLTFIALNPAFSIFAVPYIGVVSLVVILVGFIGKKTMPFNIPTGLVAILLGTAIGWISGQMSLPDLLRGFADVRVGIPSPSFARILHGFATAAPFLISAIPLGIYNFIETIDNCESAGAAGDEYNTREAMVADGVTSILGSLFGSPFPTAIYIGHPGWKNVGARIGYTLATGVCVLILSCLGLVSLLMKIIPLVAILPILLFIGVTITSQAFAESGKRYAPAVVIAMIPSLADWSRNISDITMTAAGSGTSVIGLQTLNSAGFDYFGAFSLGQGAIIVGILLGSITAFVIDHRFDKAAVSALLAALLSFFGVIHAAGPAFNANPPMTIGYLAAAGILFYFSIGNTSHKLSN